VKKIIQLTEHLNMHLGEFFWGENRRRRGKKKEKVGMYAKFA
jgi:hypothetical protein